MSRYWCRAWCQASRGSRMDLAPHSRPSSNVKCDRVNWIRMRFIFRQTTSLRRCCRCRCLRLWMKVVARKQIVKIVKSCSVNVSCGPRSKTAARAQMNQRRALASLQDFAQFQICANDWLCIRWRREKLAGCSWDCYLPASLSSLLNSGICLAVWLCKHLSHTAKLINTLAPLIQSKWYKAIAFIHIQFRIRIY